MGINLKNVVVSLAVGTVASGLLATNLNAITATASYGQTTTTFISNGVVISYSDAHDEPSSAAVESQKVTSTNLDIWLEKLAMAESNNRADIKVLDVNNRYSYGCLQFQMATFKSYSARYGYVDPATVTSWDELIYDCDLQKRIAKSMIKEKNTNWRHWGYTVLNKGIGLPPAEERAVDLAVAQ